MATLNVGGVLARSLRVFFGNFLPFTLLALVAYSPMVIWVLIFLQGPLTLSRLNTFSLVVSAGGLLLSFLATGAITYGAFAQLKGERASFGRCLSVGFSRLLPVLGVALVVAICVGLGFLALIVPGVILFCMLWLAVPATVVEKLGVFDALSRSRALTDGLKFQIFAIVLVMGVAEWGIGFALEKALLGMQLTLSQVKVALFLLVLLSVVFTAWRATAAAVTYHDVRHAKEGVELDELIAVFD
jgi:hypothetical protein